ncbi:PTS sugar transporter subunit IIC, partial [Clostridioides difficile]
GAATVGCCCQMVGFAVMSFRENGVGGLVAQGLGTSMLQVPNIIKNWKIWIPPTVASILLGPLSTTIFKMENIPIGSGMGTCGLVGQFGTVTAMQSAGKGGISMWVGIFLLNFILPAIVTLLISEFMRKKGLIKPEDLKLDV